MFRSFSYGCLKPLGKALIGFALLTGAVEAAEPVDILALGDSLTHGYGLPEDEGLVPQLSRWLEARGQEAEVVNAGVSGDTTAGGLARIEWSLTPEIDAVIVELGANDLLRGIAPEVARANLDGILEIAEARGLEVLLIGIKAPGNYGPDYQAQFNAIYADLAEKYDTLYLENFFEGLTADGAIPANAGEWMQPDGIHPNARGVARIVEVIGPKTIELIARVRGDDTP